MLASFGSMLESYQVITVRGFATSCLKLFQIASTVFKESAVNIANTVNNVYSFKIVDNVNITLSTCIVSIFYFFNRKGTVMIKYQKASKIFVF